MRKRSGFSLIELAIAIGLASLVLVGVSVVAMRMVRAHMEGIRSGTVTGWSIVSWAAMTREIESANVLAYPSFGAPAANAIVICGNWSRLMAPAPGARLDATNPATVVEYCYDSANKLMRRYANVGGGVSCPSPATPVACTASPTGTWTETGVVGFRVERLLANPTIFLRDDSIGGLRIRYAVGEQTPTTSRPIPKFIPYDIAISMQKQYSNTLD